MTPVALLGPAGIKAAKRSGQMLKSKDVTPRGNGPERKLDLGAGWHKVLAIVKTWRSFLKTVSCVIPFFATQAGFSAVVNQYGGNYTNWPSVWTSLGLNDADDGLNAYVDFVGDANDPAAFWANDLQYVYFRFRIDTDTFDNTASAARNTWLIMVDAIGYVHPQGETNRPDYAFAWDLKGDQSQPGQHGLEMTEIDVTGSKWSDQRFDDIDGSAATKIVPPDFATSGGQGYIRTTDGVSTTNFGNSTFVDFAISTLYLAAEVPNLLSNSAWRIQLATLENATDHNKISSDVAGNQSVGSTITVGSWSEPITVIPEPPATPALATLAALFLAAAYFRRRR